MTATRTPIEFWVREGVGCQPVKRVAYYNREELHHMARLKEDLLAAPEGSEERVRLMREMEDIHTAKALLDATLHDYETPMPQPRPPRPAPLPDPGRDVKGKEHRAAPKTERAAARKAMPRTGTQRRLILDVIGAAGDDGMIDEDIAKADGVADTAHRTRRNELVTDGWVVDSGRTRVTESGTDSIVWVLSDEGRERWKPR